MRDIDTILDVILAITIIANIVIQVSYREWVSSLGWAVALLTLIRLIMCRYIGV